MKSCFFQSSLASIVIVSGLLCEPTVGIVIRDDVPDADYIQLSTDPAFEAVGMLQRPIDAPNYLCGGTLIHPEWVITAAHCIPSSSSQDFQFSLGALTSEWDRTVTPDDWFKSLSFDRDNLGAGHDVGLVHLTEPILDVTPAQLYRSNSERQVTASIVGYGRTGTGLTGEDPQQVGTRRAATNRIDVFGGQVGLTVNVMLGDFDNPNNPADSRWGPTTPTDMEGMIAVKDSGGAWFIEESGVTYLAGISSFLSTGDSIYANYGDALASSRITRDQGWIDSHANVATFWTEPTGVWDTASGWDGEVVPGILNTAVVKQGIVTVTPGAVAEYTFVDGTGQLNMNSSFVTDLLLLKRGGVLAVGTASAGVVTLTGDLHQTDGSINVTLHGPNSSGQLLVTGTAEIGGQLLLSDASGYAGPSARGEIDSHFVLLASEVDGTFELIDGVPLGTDFTYVGTTSGGEDGLFRAADYSDTQVTLHSYLAVRGDANGDRVVDVSDFNIWNTNKFTTGNDWSTGDFNADGRVDVSDFNIWNTNKLNGAEVPGLSPVPEPAGWLLVLLGVAGVGRHRWSALGRGNRQTG